MDEDLAMKKIKRKKRIRVGILLLIGILVIILGLRIFQYFSENKTPNPFIRESSQVIHNITPTPMPFYEMTIPGFRSRAYNSNLGSLEEISRNANYTSYLTNYDSDGFRVNGQLTIPTGEEPAGGFPAIIFVHGYIPPSTYRTLSNYADYVDYLARNGFVVFKIDLRGHGDSEGEAGGGYYSSDYVVDVLNAKSALQNLDFVKSAGIGFWGHSMAGNVVSRAMAASPDTPAIVIWGGAVYTYSDFQEYGIDDNSYRPPSDQSESRRKRNQLFETHGQFDPNNEFWKQVPMTNYLNEITGAIQLNHAVNDDVVNIGFSRNLNSILDKTSIPHELHEYQSGGHNITGSAFTQAMINSVNFFNKYLK